MANAQGAKRPAQTVHPLNKLRIRKPQITAIDDLSPARLRDRHFEKLFDKQLIVMRSHCGLLRFLGRFSHIAGKPGFYNWSALSRQHHHRHSAQAAAAPAGLFLLSEH
jgi:hypothetical protein